MKQIETFLEQKQKIPTGFSCRDFYFILFMIT